MTYLPGIEQSSFNGVDYADWEAAVRRIFFDVTGIQSGREGINIDDLGDIDLYPTWEKGTNAREAGYDLLNENNIEFDRSLDDPSALETVNDTYGAFFDGDREDWIYRPLNGRERVLGVG